MVALGPEKTAASKLRGLSADKLWRGISADRQEAIYDYVVEEYKPVLVESLHRVIREQVEEEMGERAKAAAEATAAQKVEAEKTLRRTLETEALKKAYQEVEAERPTAKQKAAFQTFVQEVEVDAHAQAAVASANADRATHKLRWSRRLMNPLGYAAFLSTLPILYGVWHLGNSASSVEFKLTGLFMAVVVLLLAVTNSRRHSRLEEKARSLYRTASDYLVVAERAKTMRIVHAERLESQKKLGDLTFQLETEKTKLDREFHPSVNELTEARITSRQRILTDGPLPVTFEDDFAQRLEEAQAEAEVAHVDSRGLAKTA